MKSSTHFELLVIIVCLLHQAASTGLPIFCLDTDVPLGGKTQVVCHFNKDVSVSQTDFTIWKFPFGTTTFESRIGKPVLVYNWIQRKKQVEPGYGFDGDTISSNVVLTIDNATSDQEGIYRCLLINDQTPIRTCSLRVLTEDGNQATQNTSGFISSPIPTWTIILIVGLLLFICFSVTYYCYKGKCQRTSTVDQEIQTTTAERATNTVKPNTVDIGTYTDDVSDQPPVATSSKEKSSGRSSKKEDKSSLWQKQLNRQSVDNRPSTDHTEDMRSVLNQPAKNQSMQALATTNDDEKQLQQQPLLHSGTNSPALAPDNPRGRDQDTKNLATSRLQSSRSFDGESHEEEVGSDAADSSVRLVKVGNVSGYNHQGQLNLDTTNDVNGKDPEKEKEGLIGSLLRSFRKK